MPIAQISIVAGRSPEKVQRMAEAVTRTIAETLDAPIETVRVLITEVPPERWYAGGESMATRRARDSR